MRRDLRTALSGIYGEAEVVRSLSTAVLGWPVCLQKALMSDGGGAQMEAVCGMTGVCITFACTAVGPFINRREERSYKGLQQAVLIGNNNEKYP